MDLYQKRLVIVSAFLILALMGSPGDSTLLALAYPVTLGLVDNPNAWHIGRSFEFAGRRFRAACKRRSDSIRMGGGGLELHEFFHGWGAFCPGGVAQFFGAEGVSLTFVHPGVKRGQLRTVVTVTISAPLHSPTPFNVPITVITDPLPAGCPGSSNSPPTARIRYFWDFVGRESDPL